MGNDNGVIYYSVGAKCLTRLYVSIYSLRKIYPGPITILTETGDPNVDALRRIADDMGCDARPVRMKIPAGPKTVYLAKCRLHEFTPYEYSVFLDADTLVLRPFMLEMISALNDHDFAITAFANWNTVGRIGKRINAWRPLYPQMIDAARDYGTAINYGVFAFRRRSRFMTELYRHALPGRELSRIPDETCCQLILPQYPHALMSHWFNVSCRYDKPQSEEARVVHYHGNKHCRISKGRYEFHSDLWYKAFGEVRDRIPGDWIAADRQLKIGLRAHDKVKTNTSATP